MKRIIETPQLGFVEALNASTSKIFQFTGRSRRSEYWWTMVGVFLANLILTPLVGMFAELATVPLTFRRLHDIGRSGWWYGIFFIVKMLCFVCCFFDVFMWIVNVDRLEGYESEIALAFITKYVIWIGVIFVYQLLLLVFMCMDSQQEVNKYGESPKYQVVDEPDEPAGQNV